MNMNDFEAKGITPRGKILMGSLPEFGQLNPLFAIAERLVSRGHEVHFASGHSCQKRIDGFNAHLSNFADTVGKHITFHDMGAEDCINDHNYMANASPEEFADYKQILAQGPRNVGAFGRLITLVMQGSLEGRKKVTDRFVELIKSEKPDIVVVDQFTSCFVEAVRMLGVDYIVTAPASPSTLSSPSPLYEPLSGTNLESPMTLKSRMLNTWFFLNLIPRLITHPALKELREYRLNILKLKPTSKAIDSSPFSKFHKTWTNQKAIISPNLDFRQQTPFDKVIFVGTCVQRRVPVSKEDSDMYDLDVRQWLDEAIRNDNAVVYINLGTIFRYNQGEIDEIFKAVRLLNERMPGGRGVLFLWKIPRGKFDLSAMPPQIKFFEWLEDPLTVYQHTAVKACINHGGGNSFNEAIQYGIPQLVCSQWFDTIDFAVAARTSGIGLSSEHPGRMSGTDIALKVSRLLTERSFTNNTQLWSLKSRAAGGSSAAADIVETYLESKWNSRSMHLIEESDIKPAPKSRVLHYIVMLLLAGLLSVPTLKMIVRFIPSALLT